ncbi:hypothetical protein K3G39_20355 [Pontibacter sp. HSC-14F20]|nr:hypothetical protein [Pontibacter sp. HSC-14F20]
MLFKVGERGGNVLSQPQAVALAVALEPGVHGFGYSNGLHKLIYNIGY